MVVVPEGRFYMGSNPDEAGRDEDESPRHEVDIRYRFAVGRYEVTRAQFAQFLRESGYQLLAGNCWYWDHRVGAARKDDPSRSWRDPGYRQNDDHPVVCVSWHDAKAYTRWLSRKTGQRYRLLTEAEWEYAARAGSSTARPWGENPADACAYANVGDQARDRAIPPPAADKEQFWAPAHNCDDGYAYTAPVGRFKPNAFGLHDMIGNVWEWTEDCGNPSYAGAPSDGRAWLEGNCTLRQGRAASWYHTPRHARSANRHRVPADSRLADLGFRVARTF